MTQVRANKDAVLIFPLEKPGSVPSGTLDRFCTL